MGGCVFCQIVKREVPAQILSEDENFVAFLGILPKFPGMTVIATKRHTDDSYLYRSLSDEELTKMHLFAKKVALALDKALGSVRNIQVMEGFDLDHAHLKLFPVYEGKLYNSSYEGREKAGGEELSRVAKRVRKVVKL